MKPVSIHVPSQYEAYLMTEQFDQIRQAVFKRDGHKCVICGSTQILQAHHLTYRNLGNEQTGDLITLCKNCHSIYHAIDRRREAVEAIYIREQRNNEYEQRYQDGVKAERKRRTESVAIMNEIKSEFLLKDYCKNGDLDMLSWETLNKIIEKKCTEHGIDFWTGNKSELRSWFHYRRCELLLRCMDKGLTYDKVKNSTKFDSGWLYKWYRRDKCEAKLNEEKELYKEN